MIADTHILGVVYLLGIKKKAKTHVQLLIDASQVIKNENKKKCTYSNRTYVSEVLEVDIMGLCWPMLAVMGLH